MARESPEHICPLCLSESIGFVFVRVYVVLLCYAAVCRHVALSLMLEHLSIRLLLLCVYLIRVRRRLSAAEILCSFIALV